ncbi:FCD domain-containing protein [Sphingopyxis sp. PET50]|uniref:FCD domain-containing protein n=1 Tax=Sphingopyxis sp. PET50 TaxID=2976533 RepID=UPI0021AFE839|nr:FCD domain-containing protein [Sphingopyxis sp. PET50]
MPLLRALIEGELSHIRDRFAVTTMISEFHSTMIDLAGNQTLIMFSHALRGLVEEHMNLAQRRNINIDPEFSMKQLRFGLKSHSKLVDLIEAKDGAGAEAHWKSHMVAVRQGLAGAGGAEFGGRSDRLIFGIIAHIAYIASRQKQCNHIADCTDK